MIIDARAKWSHCFTTLTWAVFNGWTGWPRCHSLHTMLLQKHCKNSVKSLQKCFSYPRVDYLSGLNNSKNGSQWSTVPRIHHCNKWLLPPFNLWFLSTFIDFLRSYYEVSKWTCITKQIIHFLENSWSIHELISCLKHRRNEERAQGAKWGQ